MLTLLFDLFLVLVGAIGFHLILKNNPELNDRVNTVIDRIKNLFKKKVDKPTETK